ncbi:hypothetical protein GCM10009076_14930 [Erythrobacter ramosus]
MRDYGDLRVGDIHAFGNEAGRRTTMGNDSVRPPDRGAHIGEGATDPIRIVRLEVMRRKYQWYPPRRQPQIEREALLAKFVPDISHAAVVGLRPVKMQQGSSRCAVDAPRKGKRAVIM